MKKYFSWILTLALLISLLAGCGENSSGGNDGTTVPSGDTAVSGTTAPPAEVDFSQTDDDMFTDRDKRDSYEENGSVLLQFNGDSVTSSSDSVQISGTTVTITEEATYILSGTLNNGMVIVNADKSAKLQLVLNGVSINSETSAPLYILAADKVFVTLAEGTENTLSNGGTFTAIDENNIDAVIFSKQDLTLNGSGSLTVTSPAGHGIVSKDDLVITGGTYTVNCASHGLDANDSVRIMDGTLTVDAGKDGIRAENDEDTSLGFIYISGGTLNIEAEGDGISAGAYLQIEDGTFDLLCGGGSENGSKESSDSWGGFMGGGMGGGMGGFMGGGPGGRSGIASSSSASTSDESSSSMKGLKAAGDMLISGGSFTINSADDAIHSNGSITINGGTFEIATGDDGVHADDTLTVTACTVNISESYEGLEAHHIVVSGGDIRLVASDDGLNAAGGTDSSGTGGRDTMFGGGMGGMGGMGGSSSDGSILVSGGTLYINSSGDGMDANGTLTISGGHTTVVGPTQGDTATLDYDVSGVITGGTFIGTGASAMAQTFGDSEQGVIALNVGNQAAGTKVTLTDSSGNVIVSFEPELSFAVVIISTPDMKTGENYTITVGSSSGEFAAS